MTAIEEVDSKNNNTNNKNIEFASWQSGWELYYWPYLGGRGLYVRLMLELGAAEYKDVLKELKSNGATSQQVYQAIIDTCQSGDNRKALAVPILIHKKNNLFLSQTPAIVLFLADIFQLKPKHCLQMARATQMMLQVFDAVEEAIVATHPVDRHTSYTEQKEEADKQMSVWLAKRLPKHLEVLNAELKRNQNGQAWFYGNRITFVDVCVATFIRAYAYSAPQHFENNADIKLLKQHRARFETQSFYQAFRKSERFPPIDSTPTFTT